MMTKEQKARLDRMDLVIFGDEQSNIIGLVEYQKRDNEKWELQAAADRARWDELKDYMRTNSDLLAQIQQQNTEHLDMTMSQEERLKKIEIVFNAFGQLSKIKKKTLVLLAGIVSFLSAVGMLKSQIVDALDKLFR